MLAIIGGSGLLQSGGVTERRNVDTPFGPPVGPVSLCRKEGVDFLFIPRHGEGHTCPPHRIPYRANLWALAQLGASRVVSLNSVGAVNTKIAPGSFVVPDQVMDFSGRSRTFYEGIPRKTRGPGLALPRKLLSEGVVVHVDLARPFCDGLRRALIEACRDVRAETSDRGAYVTTQGPRLETEAEIGAFRRLGADVVGMTLATEATLARELGLCFASLSVVTNYASGAAEERVTLQTIKRKVAELSPRIEAVVGALQRSAAVPCTECSLSISI